MSNDMQAVSDGNELSCEVIRILLLSDMGNIHENDLSALLKIMGESRFVLKVELELLKGYNLPIGAKLRAKFSFRCSCSEAEHKVENYQTHPRSSTTAHERGYQYTSTQLKF